MVLEFRRCCYQIFLPAFVPTPGSMIHKHSDSILSSCYQICLPALLPHLEVWLLDIPTAFGITIPALPFSFFEFFISLSLAEKVASVLGCVVMISMENYRTGSDDGNDIDSIDFDSLSKDIQVYYPFLWCMLVLKLCILEYSNWDMSNGFLLYYQDRN